MRNFFSSFRINKKFLLFFILFSLSFLISFKNNFVNASQIESKDILRVNTNLNIWKEAPSKIQSFLSQEKITALNKSSIGQISSDQPYVNNEILIKYKKSSLNLLDTNSRNAEDNFLKSKNLTIIRRIKSSNISVAKIADGKTVEEKIKELSSDPYVEHVQPNYIYQHFSINSNDPLNSQMWGLDNLGTTVNGAIGLPDKDIDAPEAWEILKRNNNEVIVAVIDNGVDYSMEDLEGKMWEGANCLDETGFPIVGGCMHGYDFSNDDNDPSPELNDFHGSHVAGTIASVHNNGIGVLGVAPNVKIMALKVNLVTSEIVSAINFAKQNGVKIINASWGGPSSDQNLSNAIASFPGLFVVAAGNGELDADSAGDNHDSGDTLHYYPCDYNLTNILCVAATDSQDRLATFSDFGLISVDVGAPGVNILSTVTVIPEYQNFNDLLYLNIPSNWQRSGFNNNWGMVLNEFDNNSKVLAADIYPWWYGLSYSNGSNSILSSQKIPLGNTNYAILGLYAACDTEYDLSYFRDYLKIEVSSDGNNFEEIYLLDERSLDDDYNSAGFSDKTIFLSIPEKFYTNNFRLQFSWITNYQDNAHFGCILDDIFIYREGFDFSQGTSMATPHVSGIAGMLLGYRPNLTVGQVKDTILNSGDPATGLSGKTVSGKRVNANNALLSVRGDVIDTFLFNYESQSYSCLINEKDTKVQCSLPVNYPKTNIAPTITLTGGTINPPSGTQRNFLEPLSYVYTKSDSSIETYSVEIKTYLSGLNAFRSGAGNWGVQNAKFMTSGDFDGDGKEDIGILYDYGNKDMGLIVFTSSGDTMTGGLWFRSGPGNWSVPNARFMTGGDFNGDGKDDIGIMYDYGNKDMGLIVFTSNGSQLIGDLWFRSGEGNWSVPNAKYVSGEDYTGDSKGDIGIMYDYGNKDMGLIVFSSNGSKFAGELWFRSGEGNWNVPNARFMTSADYNDDGKGDLGIMYDYGNKDMGLIVFGSSGTSFSAGLWFRSGAGNWSVPNARFMSSTDFNGDGRGDIGIMYDYGNRDMGLLVFTSSGIQMSPEVLFRSGAGNWSVPNAKFVAAGDYNGNGVGEFSIMYDYGSNDMSLILFR